LKVAGVAGLKTIVNGTEPLALSALFATSVGLHFTHKLAGPLYRFKSEFERLAEGKSIRPIVLRAGDDFQDCAAAMNRALSHIAEQKQLPNADFEEIERHRETNRVLRETLDRFDSSAMGPEDRAVAERLRTDISELLAKVDTGGAEPT